MFFLLSFSLRWKETPFHTAIRVAIINVFDGFLVFLWIDSLSHNNKRLRGNHSQWIENSFKVFKLTSVFTLSILFCFCVFLCYSISRFRVRKGKHSKCLRVCCEFYQKKLFKMKRKADQSNSFSANRLIDRCDTSRAHTFIYNEPASERSMNWGTHLTERVPHKVIQLPIYLFLLKVVACRFSFRMVIFFLLP